MSAGTLAVHPGALGDVVLFGRLLERMDGPITLVAGGQKAALLRSLGVVDAAIDFDSLPMQELFAETPVQHGRLPGLLGKHRRLISCLGDANTRPGQRLADLCRCETANFLPIRPPTGAATHLLNVWADLTGLPAFDPVAPAWAVPDDVVRQGRAALERAGLQGGGYVALAPGSGSAGKNWPINRYRRLARCLREEHGLACVWVLGPVELDRWGEASADRLREDGTVLAGPTLRELAGVLSQASAVVGNDSGPSHLAAAAGTPTVTLFGPTSPRQFRPVGPRVSIIARDRLEQISEAAVIGILAEYI